jgi:anti-sigma factor RsiW
MTADLWTDRLSEYVDRELSHAERVALEAHLEGCAECRETVELLRAVQRRAARLPDGEVRRDLWPAIAAMIGGESPLRPDEQPVRRVTPRRRYAFSLPQLAAAGIALTLVSGGAVWLARDAGGPAAPAAVVSTPTPGPDAPSITRASVSAERTFDAAVADLQAVLDAGRDRLDPRTVSVLEKNLAVIDGAVAEAQRAVAADPANAYLNSHLARTMRRKIELLRQAATLVSARS